MQEHKIEPRLPIFSLKHFSLHDEFFFIGFILLVYYLILSITNFLAGYGLRWIVIMLPALWMLIAQGDERFGLNEILPDGKRAVDSFAV